MKPSVVKNRFQGRNSSVQPTMDITNFKNKKMHLILQFNRYLTKEKQSDYYASEDDLYISKNIVKKRNIAEYSNII